MKDEAMMKRSVAKLFGLTLDQCDEVDRIVIKEILAQSKDTHQLIKLALTRFAESDREKMAFLAGHITGWLLMRAEEMNADSYFFLPYLKDLEEQRYT